MFQIPELNGWKIIVQKQFFEEILHAPEEALNFHEATFEVSCLVIGAVGNLTLINLHRLYKFGSILDRQLRTICTTTLPFGTT
jgi:hypothetical protein